MPSTIQRGVRKQRTGTVVSDAMDKTRVVRVERRMRHPVYGKELTVFKKYHVHDEQNVSHQGDEVLIMESRPLSRLKRWRLISVVKQASGKGEASNDSAQN